MSKISVTTIAGLTSGGDANKVKIDPSNTLHVPGHASIGVDAVDASRGLTVAGSTDGSGSSALVVYNSSLASKFAVRDDGLTTITNNATVGGTFAVTGNSTANSINLGGRSLGAGGTPLGVNFSSASTNGMQINDTNSGNLGGFLGFYSGSGGGTLRANIQNANNAGMHLCLGTSGTVSFGSTGYVAANALDDYEEGTFTATLVATGSTFQYTYRTGSYTKIGNTVYFNLYIQLDGGGNSFVGNAVTISGLPFTADSAARNNFRYYVHGRYLNVDGSNYYYVTANLANGSAGLSLNQAGDNVPNKALPATYLSSSSGQLFINGHYFVS